MEHYGPWRTAPEVYIPTEVYDPLTAGRVKEDATTCLPPSSAARGSLNTHRKRHWGWPLTCSEWGGATRWVLISAEPPECRWRPESLAAAWGSQPPWCFLGDSKLKVTTFQEKGGKHQTVLGPVKKSLDFCADVTSWSNSKMIKDLASSWQNCCCYLELSPLIPPCICISDYQCWQIFLSSIGFQNLWPSSCHWSYAITEEDSRFCNCLVTTFCPEHHVSLQYFLWDKEKRADKFSKFHSNENKQTPTTGSNINE